MPDESDDAVRALFHRIDDGPPLDIDVREVMAKGRQIRTRRTRLAVAGSALAVVAAATLVGVSTGGDARDPDMFRPAVTPTQPPTTSPEPPVPAPSTQTTTPRSTPEPPAGPPQTSTTSGPETVPGDTPPGARTPGGSGAG